MVDYHPFLDHIRRCGVVEHIRVENLVMQSIPAAFSISSSYGWGDTEGLPEITATTPATATWTHRC